MSEATLIGILVGSFVGCILITALVMILMDNRRNIKTFFNKLFTKSEKNGTETEDKKSLETTNTSQHSTTDNLGGRRKPKKIKK
jgi:hypothetical protein